MATATVPSATPALAPHRFTAADYGRMLEAGILHEDDRVELLAGQVVRPEAWCVVHVRARQRGHVSC